MAAKPTTPSVALQSRDEIEKVFNRFDSNGDGKISISELASVLHALGSATSKDDLDRMMAELDSDGDGSINLNEFADFFTSGKAGDDQDRSETGGDDHDLKDAFDLYDLDKNGLISASELHMVLKRLGEKCTVQDCSKMIRTVDSDGDGNVNFEEFKKMMTNGIADSKQ